VLTSSDSFLADVAHNLHHSTIIGEMISVVKFIGKSHCAVIIKALYSYYLTF